MGYPVRHTSTSVQHRKRIESLDVLLIQHDITSIRTLAIECIGIFFESRVFLSGICTCRKFNFPRLIQMQIQVAAADTVMHERWIEREREREIYASTLVVYSSGVHISRRLRTTTRLFTQQTYRSAALNSFQPCASRGCTVTHQVCVCVCVLCVCIAVAVFLRLDVVDDEQSTPVSKTTRVIFIINYMASAYGPLPASGRCPGTGLINKLTHGGGPRHVGWTHPSIRPLLREPTVCNLLFARATGPSINYIVSFNCEFASR